MPPDDPTRLEPQLARVRDLLREIRGASLEDSPGPGSVAASAGAISAGTLVVMGSVNVYAGCGGDRDESRPGPAESDEIQRREVAG